MDPYLSIIVPIYKTEIYLRQCVDSILAQTFKDFEVILVDDGSPDNCSIICDEYAMQDKRIKVIHKENEGLVSARKAGLRTSKGRYIGFVDSDDWIEKEMYSLLCEAAKKYEADIVTCDALKSFPDKEIKYENMIEPGLYNINNIKNNIYPFMLYLGTFYKFGILPVVWNKIFKAEIIKNNQYNVNEAIHLGEDVACTYPCLLDSNSIYILKNKYLYHYRQVSSAMTSSYDPEFLKGFLELSKLLKSVNEEKNKFDITQQLHYYFLFVFTIAVDNEFHINNRKSIRGKCDSIKSIGTIDVFKEALSTISLAGLSFKHKLYFKFFKNHHNMILCFVILILKRIKKMKFLQEFFSR